MASSSVKDAPLPAGLTSDEVRHRTAKFGPNAVPDTAMHPLRRALTKFWAPVPWMLEAAIVVEIALGKYVEAAIIAVLLAFNAALGFLQEGARSSHPCCTEVAARAERAGPPR
jgi:H+-transporting ATPase